jgi:hypothetical protein
VSTNFSSEIYRVVLFNFEEIIYTFSSYAKADFICHRFSFRGGRIFVSTVFEVTMACIEDEQPQKNTENAFGEVYSSECAKSLSENELKISTTASFDTVETDMESESDLDMIEAPPQPERRLTWSDEVGHDLATIHALNRMEQATIRIIVLLMHGKTEQFEFVHCEFQTEDCLLVRDVLDQLPQMATRQLFHRTRFVSLLREASPNCEFLNCLNLQHYGLQDGEIVIAADYGSHPRRHCLKPAQRLLKSHSKILRKAAKKARIQGRSLRMLKSTSNWTAEKTRPSERGREKEHDQKLTMKRDKRKHNDSEDEDEDGAMRGFVPRKVLREHKRMTDEARQKRLSDRIKQRRRRRRKYAHIFEVITWCRTSELRARLKSQSENPEKLHEPVSPIDSCDPGSSVTPMDKGPEAGEHVPENDENVHPTEQDLPETDEECGQDGIQHSSTCDEESSPEANPPLDVVEVAESTVDGLYKPSKEFIPEEFAMMLFNPRNGVVACLALLPALLAAPFLSAQGSSSEDMIFCDLL